MSYVAYDFETGGLDEKLHPIVEVAMISFDIVGDKIVEFNRYESIVKPYGDKIITTEALAANGMKISNIMKGNDIKDVVNNMAFIIKEKTQKRLKPIMVGHNSSNFDVLFAREAFSFCKKNFDDLVNGFEFDTLSYARLFWRNNSKSDGSTSNKLITCCERAGIKFVDAHHAMNDTVATMKLFHWFALQMGDNKGSDKTEVKQKMRVNFEF